MISEFNYHLCTNTNQEHLQLDKHNRQSVLQSLWAIFRAVVSTGDTYVFPPDTSKQDFQNYWLSPNNQVYIYQNSQSQVVATYIIKPNQIGLGSHIANASFMVHPSQQGKGIGKILCQHCLDSAKQLGFRAMQFNIVISTNLAAISVWKKFDFKIIGTIPQAFHNLKLDKYVDAYIMYRKL